MLGIKSFFGILILIASIFIDTGLPKNIEKKVIKELGKTFQSNEFELQQLSISDAQQINLPKSVEAKGFHLIHAKELLLGYVYVDKARSKTAEFDYMVVFNSDLEVVQAKVLIYREEYGGEIGSKRWLKQFIGKTGTDRVKLENNIDGIAGATISVRSMTASMDNLLQAIGILQKNQVL